MEKNTPLYKVMIGIVIVWNLWTIVATILVVTHKCPEPTPKLQEVNQKYVEQIKEISHAETKDDIDSLLREFYGFESK